MVEATVTSMAMSTEPALTGQDKPLYEMDPVLKGKSHVDEPHTSPLQVWSDTPSALMSRVKSPPATSESRVPLPVIVLVSPVVIDDGEMVFTWPGTPEPQSEMAKLILSALAAT